MDCSWPKVGVQWCFSTSFAWIQKFFLWLYMLQIYVLLCIERTRHSRDPQKQNSTFTSQVFTDFYYSPPNARQHSPLGPLVLPACFGLVCSKRMVMKAQREKETDRECAVLTSEEELTAMAWGLHSVVWSWVCRRGTERCLPTTPNNNLDGLAAWCVHRRPDRLKILQGINNSQQHCEGFRQRKQWARTQSVQRLMQTRASL